MSTGIQHRPACHPEAWAFLKSYYLRPARPSFAQSYQALMRAAHEHGWAPIPSKSSLFRRLHAEIPMATQVNLRMPGKPVRRAR